MCGCQEVSEASPAAPQMAAAARHQQQPPPAPRRVRGRVRGAAAARAEPRAAARHVPRRQVAVAAGHPAAEHALPPGHGLAVTQY